jgi:hypothetical protein
MPDTTPIIGSVHDDSEQFRIDEARKRGIASPGGIGALLGELDYYQLIENLVRGPVTEKQLLTPYRWWLFFKGSAFGSIAGTVLLLVRVGLLLPGEDMDYRIKFGAFMVFYSILIFGFGNMFMKYLVYPDGATWTAVRFALAGFSTGLVFSETLKEGFMLWTVYVRDYVVAHIYKTNAILDAVLEMYYNSFISTYTEEIALLMLCYMSVGYFWLYFGKMSDYRRNVLKTGKPYDLGVE